MKTHLILITFGILIGTGCYAQNKFPEGLSEVKNEQFQITYTGLNKDLIVVYNVKGKHAKGGPASEKLYPLPYKREDIHFDKSAAYAIIQNVFNLKKEKLHQNDDFVTIGIEFEGSGRISDIDYGMKKGTLISLADIAEIDARLRKSITATFTGEVYKEYKFLRYSLGMIEF